MKDDPTNFRSSAAQPNLTEDDDGSSLISLIEQHRNETWEWKQRESQWIKDKNQLEGHKRIVEELSAKIVEISKINLAHKELNGRLQTRLTEVKGIDLNSLEMKALQAKVNELEGTLGSAKDINEEHQRYNGKLQTRLTEVKEDNKKLSKQIEDLNNQKS